MFLDPCEETREEKQAKLVAVLQELSMTPVDDKSLRSRFIGRFEEIYSDDFRHSYSELLPVISEVVKASEKQEFSEEVLLIKNLNVILEDLCKNPQGDPSLKTCVFKLFDHINLELAHFHYFTKGLEGEIKRKELENKMEHLRKKTYEFDSQLKNIENKLNDAAIGLKNTISQLQGQFVAILAIFASITLVFFGGMKYVSSAVSTIKRSDFTISAFVITISGLAMANTVFLLLYYIGKIIGQDLKVRYILLLNLVLIFVPILLSCFYGFFI